MRDLLQLEGRDDAPLSSRLSALPRFRNELVNPDPFADLVEGRVERPPLVVAHRDRARKLPAGLHDKRLLGWPLELAVCPLF